MIEYPTAEQPTEHIAHGRIRGRAFTFTEDGTWRIEHCQGGRWGSCPLIVYGTVDDERAVRNAVLRHLARKPHNFDFPQRLAGTHHGGGGEKVDGEWKKCPVHGDPKTTTTTERKTA